MRGYMRKRRAKEYAQRDAEIARLLEIDERERRVADGTATLDDLQAMLDEIKAARGLRQQPGKTFAKKVRH
jgi:hypothetical protein